MTVWWEVKAEDGQLTVEQFGFLRDELDHGRAAGCGTAQHLQQYLAAVLAVAGTPGRNKAAVTHGELAVTAWQLRGFRGVPTARQPTRRQKTLAAERSTS